MTKLLFDYDCESKQCPYKSFLSLSEFLYAQISLSSLKRKLWINSNNVHLF